MKSRSLRQVEDASKIPLSPADQLREICLVAVHQVFHWHSVPWETSLQCEGEETISTQLASGVCVRFN